MMIKRRLYLQIYLTIIASLMAVVAIVAMLAFIADKGGPFEGQVFELTARLASMALPPATAPPAQQAKALQKLGDELKININLFDANRNLIATYGDKVRSPQQEAPQKRWHKHGKGPGWVVQLADKRWLIIDLKPKKKRNIFATILILLAAIATAIALASYPFVRKITRRLETLQTGVEQISQDLSARVEVKGQDEIAQLAQSFNRSADKIQGLVNANRQLLANASHELRTPLARVRLGVEMQKNNYDDKRQKALEQDISELDTLIDEILLMSRLDAGTQPAMNEHIDLLALAAEECARYDDCTVTGSSVEIMGNTTLLRRALRNLVENGFKHGSAPVLVHIDKTSDQKGAKGATHSKQTITLTVTDAGEGIKEALHEQVFQPFYRAPDKQNVEGFGLGLALVRQIAQAHKAKVKIIPATSQGFSIAMHFSNENDKMF